MKHVITKHTLQPHKRKGWKPSRYLKNYWREQGGRVPVLTTPEGKIAYKYNEFGQQTFVQTDNDQPTLYSYDNFGRLKTVSSGSQTTSYEYDAFGNLAKETTTEIKNNETLTLVAVYQYDVMNRLKKLTNFKDANENGVLDAGDDRISQFDYDLDDLGRKEKAIEAFGNDDTQTNIINWTYDNAGRLIRETFNHYDDSLDQAQEWEYDSVGNRTSQKTDKGLNGIWEAFATYEYDVNDRLINEIVDDLTDANKDKVTQYGYDHTQQTSKSVSENGILVSETTFEYDAHGRMSVVTIITENRKEITKYEYGADGIRTSAEHEVWENEELKSKTRTEYLNDPLNITGYSQVLKQTETDIISGDETVTTYVIGHQRISQSVTKGGTEQEHVFTFDGHGSTRVLLGLADAITQLYSFDAYGNALGFDTSQALTEFLYSGEQFDSKIGQQYLRTRYYDPATGRFNRLDPFFGNLNDPQSLHKYLYTHADPINRIDPSGLMSLGGAMMAGAIAGGLAGMSSGAVYGGYRSAQKHGTIWGIDTLKYAILGGVGGAALGTLVASGGWLAYHGALLQTLSSGSSWTYTKFFTSFAHSNTWGIFGSGAAIGFVYGRLQPELEHWTVQDGFSADSIMIAGLGSTSIASCVNTILIEGARVSSPVHRILSSSGATMFIEKISSNGLTHKFPIAASAKGVTTFTTSFITGFTVGYYLGTFSRCLDENFDWWPL